jgi:hypothetical protein
MKTIRSAVFCLSTLLFTASLLQGQDLSKYRGFTLGASVASVLKVSDQRLADVKTIHARPVLIQELSWWPPSTLERSAHPDSVEQIVFSFSNGALYKMSITYDRSSTEGLNALDLVKSISAKYGPATSVESEIDPAMSALYKMKPESLASWQDSQYSFDLVRTSFGDFGLVVYSKQVNAEVELATAEAVKFEEQERPGKEADAKKKEADDLEVTREKNQKSFRP